MAMIAHTPTSPVQAAAPGARVLMPVPPPAPSAAVALRLQACDAALPTLQPCRLPCQQLWAHRGKPQMHAAARQLRHRLSPCMRMPALDLPRLAEIEAKEARIYQDWRRTVCWPLSMADVQRFIALCTGGDGALRTTPVWICSHDGHSQLPMVPADHSAKRLAQLLRLLADGAVGVGITAAVLVLALVNNAHAFCDGNGRLGRALFNFCLHRAGLPDQCFLPLKTLTVLSRGGYEIRLREAELCGRWDGLYAYHCTAMELYAWLGKQPATPDQNEDV
ncbi:Fic family protein [Stenotrophomonas rhizophila]|nr:Fic family protein [Stenotrophomonas rhizophila]